MKNKILVGAGLSACALAWAAKDPVIMTVNGIDVPRSEFEYLYHKNSQQQLAPQPLDEYVEMFKVYKLKVAEARALGIDTTAKFKKEMAQYRAELAQPYLTDSLYIEQLLREAVDRSAGEVETSHIMLFKRRDEAENVVARQRLDSIRSAILAGEDFGEMAVKFSEDKAAKNNRGNLGWLVANRFPYTFETVAYATPEGEISEVFESPMAYHIIKTGKRRPAQGKVRASHIMKMCRPGATPEQEARAKQQIDSIYQIVKADPSRFAEIAKTASDDPGTAARGGDLNFFGPGEMVPEFEQTAFALAEGEISEPVKSMFGWHIIQRTGTQGVPGLEQVKPELLRRFNAPQDGRHELIRKHDMERLAGKHKGKVNDASLKALKELAASGTDSLFFVKSVQAPYAAMTMVEIGKNRFPVSEFIQTIRPMQTSDAASAAAALEKASEAFLYNKLVEAEEDWLYANNPDYRNLLNEYRDGSLLYEVSVEKVWDKAAKDKEGLDQFFKDHKCNYSWTVPHAKGILVQAKNDSVAALVKARMSEISVDSVIPKIRKEFKGKVHLERVLVEQGANAMVDNIVFGAPDAKPTVSGYTAYFMYDPKVIMTPEEVGDVRGLVTGDYQTELETIWVDELKQKYPVKVNEKELKKIK